MTRARKSAVAQAARPIVLETGQLVHDEAQPMRVAVRPSALDDGTLRNGRDLIAVPM
jgi:hypothetical protein